MSLIESPPVGAAADEDVAGLQDKKGSLLPVIRVIPASAYENPTWKGLAYFGRDLLAVRPPSSPACILFDHPLAVVALWVAVALVVSALFIVGHDAAHEALFKSRRMNSIIGHLAMLPSWHVFEGWVLGHNRIHHKYTVRQGMDFVWHPYTAEQWQEMSKFQRLRHRFEWSWLGAGAYYTREVWWHKMMVGKPPARWVKPIRRDRIIINAWIAVTVPRAWSPSASPLRHRSGSAVAAGQGGGDPVPGLQLRHRLGGARPSHPARPSAGGPSGSGPSSGARWRAPRSCG